VVVHVFQYGSGVRSGGRQPARQQTRCICVFCVANRVFHISVQFPSDDGTCALLVTEKQCKSRVSILDENAHKCEWKDSDKECVYLDPVITMQVGVAQYVCLLFCA
jgi:hypothetical protein